MISIEVESYRVLLVAAKHYSGFGIQVQDPVIFLYDGTGRFFARVNFRLYEDLSGVQSAQQDGLPWFHLSYLVSDYQFVLDILRNEKPVYLHVTEELDPSAILSTSLEPIGEGEGPV